MKILQILPELNAGGVERGTLEIGKYLVQNGHQSIVVSNGGRLTQQLEEEGSRHIKLPIHKKSLATLRQIPVLRQLFQTEQPDIIHLRSRLPAWIAWLAWLSIPVTKRPRLITTVHGFYSVNAYSAVMTKGESVICVSSGVRDYVLNNYQGTDPSKLQVIHRGVDPKAYPYDYRPTTEWLKVWEKGYPQTEGKYIVALPGRITRWKGALDFIDVISQVKKKGIPVHGLLIGEPHPRKQDFLKTLQKAIVEAGLGNDISLVGHRSDLREIMALSDVVVSCSTEPEAFGRVTLEALTLGKPVAAYSHGGVKEQLDALLPAGKIIPGDTGAMAECLCRWYHAPEKPQPNEDFTLQGMVEKIASVYSKLL